jgi:hypothetical protein
MISGINTEIRCVISVLIEDQTLDPRNNIAVKVAGISPCTGARPNWSVPVGQSGFSLESAKPTKEEYGKI